ncbi:xanthine dehydrogenase small subunit [Turneriella parva]|uniref:Molybdopterin dehydrogenase FAD-binding protein n=1 Tax=Turneriella parva (strain ATCC BAA-1111 / DSM 21527 / NCTC 11395 / H) TaxID=869212 RepID=I4B3S8_TURPD|nr:FAD binding domain-containing protein [Turneriella parva]AFM11935.1 molybdopterin dehydrogenase FAD-binding protein [Turneriella parva DSM 21527]
MATTRENVIFYLNNERIEVSGSQVFQPLSTWLRYRKGMTGTKVVCSEGDCGACTVMLGWLVGEPGRTMHADRKLEYRIIDSCIQFLFQLDLCHVITVEGISSQGELHPAQKAMVECFGSQCGFCTPGFVMALAHLTEERALSPVEGQRAIDASCIKDKLAGNLCRCTGYEAIVKAGLALNGGSSPKLLERFDRTGIEREFNVLASHSVKVTGAGGELFFKPQSLAEALKLRAAMPQLKIVAGGTDLGVQHNKGKSLLTQVMFIAHLHEIAGVKQVGQALEIGAAANWSDVLAATEQRLPELYAILKIFAAEQIRNAATIGGNIINASPIADSLPCLYVLGAKLELTSITGSREVEIHAFYTGYKRFDLQPNEILTKIILPLPAADAAVGLYKVSKRRDLDISTVTLGLHMKTRAGKITEAHLAAGGVAATIVRLRSAEKALVGSEWTAATFAQAGQVATAEISPLSDVRGSAEFRKALVKNLFLKFYHESPSALSARAGSARPSGPPAGKVGRGT